MGTIGLDICLPQSKSVKVTSKLQACVTRVLSRDPELVRGFPSSYHTRLGHTGVGSLESHFLGALEFSSVELGVMSGVKFFSCFQGLACGKHGRGSLKSCKGRKRRKATYESIVGRTNSTGLLKFRLPWTHQEHQKDVFL